MVEWWWGVVGAVVPVLLVRQVVKTKQGHAGDKSTIAKKSPTDQFVCERVCTSKRMLSRVGPFSKDPVSPDSCVTVCGVSKVDACGEACTRSVCATGNHVPNWNETCLRRCQAQCLQLSAS